MPKCDLYTISFWKLGVFGQVFIYGIIQIQESFCNQLSELCAGESLCDGSNFVDGMLVYRIPS